ncbi:hypothetical protein C8Q74DRAFT_1230150 [Fomes fomentarius]|nr:hypothetical protein C8Q74DRAFT_1230150 [Fomes fomentarius]
MDGRTYEPALREAASLNVTRSWLHWLFLCVHWFLTWFVSDIVELHVHSIAGRGLRATACRIVYSGVPLILKFPHPHEKDALAREWAALTLSLPRQASTAARLPIPTYYGLFKLVGYHVIVMSDNGVSLDQLRHNSEEMKPRIEEAVTQLRSAGIEPTDINSRNCVWDGDRLKIIDFVDSDVA